MISSLSDLCGKNIVVYDLEIKKPIEECSNGWNSHDEMGISVGCAYDYRTGKFRVFMDDNIGELVERLNEPDTLVVAFNHVGFDNKLLRAQGHQLRPDQELNNYDMLLVSRKGACGSGGRSPGFRLDDHLQALSLPMKTGDGAKAPIWWQQGLLGQLIDYCLNDVTQEKALFEYMILNGKAACKAYPNPYSVEMPKILN